MSESSGASIESGGGRYRCDGVPEKCWCKNEIVSKMSKSEMNPNRRYFRCELAHKNKIVNDNHVFKWVDEALVYDVIKLKKEVEALKGEVMENQKIIESVYDKFEYGLLEAKKERAMMKKMILGIGCGLVSCCMVFWFGVSKVG